MIDSDASEGGAEIVGETGDVVGSEWRWPGGGSAGTERGHEIVNPVLEWAEVHFPGYALKEHGRPQVANFLDRQSVKDCASLLRSP